jgi:DNA-binding CsgD family transcriptional regulator
MALRPRAVTETDRSAVGLPAANELSIDTTLALHDWPRAPHGTRAGRYVDDDPPRLEVAGRTLLLLLVDGLIPQHLPTQGAKGVRLVYADNEIAHFDYGGHRYSLVEASRQSRSDAEDLPTGIFDVLTPRELQVVQLICMGFRTKQVADRLRISEFTVRSYLKTVYAKLGVRSRSAMVCSYMSAFGPRSGATALRPQS